MHWFYILPIVWPALSTSSLPDFRWSPTFIRSCQGKSLKKTKTSWLFIWSAVFWYFNSPECFCVFVCVRVVIKQKKKDKLCLLQTKNFFVFLAVSDFCWKKRGNIKQSFFTLSALTFFEKKKDQWWAKRNWQMRQNQRTNTEGGRLWTDKHKGLQKLHFQPLIGDTLMEEHVKQTATALSWFYFISDQFKLTGVLLSFFFTLVKNDEKKRWLFSWLQRVSRPDGIITWCIFRIKKNTVVF